MAQQQIAPRADQPRVSTEQMKRKAEGPQLEYRVSGVKSFDRSPKTRTYGRTVRG